MGIEESLCFGCGLTQPELVLTLFAVVSGGEVFSRDLCLPWETVLTGSRVLTEWAAVMHLSSLSFPSPSLCSAFSHVYISFSSMRRHNTLSLPEVEQMLVLRMSQGKPFFLSQLDSQLQGFYYRNRKWIKTGIRQSVLILPSVQCTHSYPLSLVGTKQGCVIFHPCGGFFWVPDSLRRSWDCRPGPLTGFSNEI